MLVLPRVTSCGTATFGGLRSLRIIHLVIVETSDNYLHCIPSAVSWWHIRSCWLPVFPTLVRWSWENVPLKLFIADSFKWITCLKVGFKFQKKLITFLPEFSGRKRSVQLLLRIFEVFYCFSRWYNYFLDLVMIILMIENIHNNIHTNHGRRRLPVEWNLSTFGYKSST